MRNQELLDKRIAFIRRIVDRCDDIGKTKIQKISYFLQESVGAELGYRFRIHYYGPYSDDLDDALSFAESLGFVDIEPGPGRLWLSRDGLRRRESLAAPVRRIDGA